MQLLEGAQALRPDHSASISEAIDSLRSPSYVHSNGNNMVSLQQSINEFDFGTFDFDEYNFDGLDTNTPPDAAEHHSRSKLSGMPPDIDDNKANVANQADGRRFKSLPDLTKIGEHIPPKTKIRESLLALPNCTNLITHNHTVIASTRDMWEAPEYAWFHIE